MFQFDSSTLADGFGAFTRESAIGGNNRARFNGLQLTRVQTGDIPEPASAVLFEHPRPRYAVQDVLHGVLGRRPAGRFGASGRPRRGRSALRPTARRAGSAVRYYGTTLNSR